MASEPRMRLRVQRACAVAMSQFVVFGLLLTFATSSFADAPVVGDPGSSTITITNQSAQIGGFVIDDTNPPPPIGPVAVADNGNFIWPADALALAFTGTIPDQEIANLPLTYDLAIENASMQASFTAPADETAVVNPVTQSISVDAYGGIDGTLTANLTGQILGIPFAGSVSCTWPTAITTLQLSTSPPSALPYDPSTGTFKMVDSSVAVSSTPTCDYLGLTQEMEALAETFIQDYISFPTIAGYVSISGTMSPAPQPATFGEITAAPTVVGAMREKNLVTCVALSAGLPTPTVTFVWQRDQQAIAGATSQTHRLSAADAGHSIRCGATATNIVGSGGMALSSERRVPARCVVPKVVGRRLARARAMIVARHCKVKRIVRVTSTRPSLTVTATRPRAGTAHPAKTPISIFVSR